MKLKSIKPKFQKFKKKNLIILITSTLLGLSSLFIGIKLNQAYKKITNSQPNKVSTVVYDRNGEVLYQQLASNDMFFIPVAIENVPDHYLEILIHIEDQNFFQHKGVDFLALLRAAYNTILGNTQGASTLTQQMVKNQLGNHSRNLPNKITEILIANKVEKNLTKDEILEMYLNSIEFGNLSKGIYAASNRYFGKNPSQLSIAESITLITIAQNPTHYNPYTDRGRITERKNILLEDLYRYGKISRADYEIAKAQEPEVKPNIIPMKAPYFVDYVLQSEYVNSDDKIVTTLDLTLNTRFQRILDKNRKQLQNNYGAEDIGVVLIDNKTGEIISMIGNYNYWGSAEGNQINNTTTKRDTGSAIKPIIYSLGFKKGLKPSSLVADYEKDFQFYNPAGEKQTYRPRNVDLQEHGIVTLKESLANSYNIPPVKILKYIGTESLRDFYIKLDLPHQDIDLTSALGTTDMSLIHLTSLYTIFGNSGNYSPPSILIGGNNHVYNDVFGPKSDYISYAITDTLSDPSARTKTFGNTLNYPVEFDYAIKTGTSSNFRDNLAISYTEDLTLGIWVGNTNNNQMKQSYGSDTAAQIAKKLWFELENYYTEENFALQKEFKKPESTQLHDICITEKYQISTNCQNNKQTVAIPTNSNIDDNLYDLIAKPFNSLEIVSPQESSIWKLDNGQLDIYYINTLKSKPSLYVDGIPTSFTKSSNRLTFDIEPGNHEVCLGVDSAKDCIEITIR